MSRTRVDSPELAAIGELAGVLDGADHVDVKTIESGVSLREFVAGALGVRHWWVSALFGVRVVFAWLLRLNQAGSASARSSTSGPLRPDQLPFVPGSTISFFTVRAAVEGRYLLLAAADTHLTGQLAIVVDPANRVGLEPAGRRRFRVITVVHYHHWTGPLYFTIVRPFHHLVVGSMVRAGALGAPRARQAQNRNSSDPTAAR